MKKIGNYIAFKKISGIKSLSKMSPRGRKATMGDFRDTIPLLLGLGVATYFYVKSKKNKPAAFTANPNEPVKAQI